VGPERLKVLFGEALDLPGSQRASFIDRECAGDAALRAAVLRLLDAHDRGANFLNPARDVLFAAQVPAIDEADGADVGPYRLVRRLGEGGFGRVFLAEQQTPIVRHVALKIIKAGMDTRQVIARFEAERQALALMDHPSIARVLDAGATASGRPYFVMEYVPGEAITRYCDQKALDLPGRLALFQQVCHAVQHAHRKGIIHRDIKPTNILVAEVDGRPLPKVIDFGIAKATGGPRAAGGTLVTDSRQFLGTPEYMAPEQAVLGPVDADTRSDIYSLGVILYELLTGACPLDPQLLRAAEWDEMRRLIREHDPPRPSDRLLHGARRSNEPGTAGTRSLATLLRADLDWIVMKCLEKDPARRYETAYGLALDIQRHLQGEPVLAAPPSTLYRFRKLVRRHRTRAAVGAVLLFSTLMTIGGTTTFALRESRQRAQAEERARETNQVARFQAALITGIPLDKMGAAIREDLLLEAGESWRRAGLADSEVAARTSQLASLLEDVNFSNTAMRTLDQTIFERALTDIDAQFKERPLLRAAMLQSLATAMTALNLHTRAVAPQLDALHTRESMLGPDAPETLESLQGVSNLYASRFEFEKAEPYALRALEGRRRVLGEVHAATLESKAALAMLLQRQWRLADAEPLRAEVLAGARSAHGDTHPDTLRARLELGRLLLWQGKVTLAEHEMTAVIRDCQAADPPQEWLLNAAAPALALIRQVQGRFEEAEQICLRSLEQRRSVLGDDNRHTLFLGSRMAGLSEAQGLHQQAIDRWRAVLAGRRRSFGDHDWETLCAADALGAMLILAGNLDEGEPLVRSVLASRGQLLPPDHPEQARSLWSMGLLLHHRGDRQAAHQHFEQAMEARRRHGGYLELDTFQWLPLLAGIMQADGRTADAERILRNDIHARTRLVGPDTPGHAAAVVRLSTFLRTHGRAAEAERELHAALATAGPSSQQRLRDELTRLEPHAPPFSPPSPP
jgi:serine/threonine protein kinase/tetratricopeptide (TPR) repeat protein